jgi:general secretion pathway protein J
MTAAGSRQGQPWRHAAAGMTLIEMLVALAIFAVLGIMGYRAASTAMESRQRVVAELQRWRDIANLVQIVEIDLSQYIERPGATASGVAAIANGIVLTSADGGSQLSFLKLDGGGGSVRRRGYRLDGQRVLQLRWPGTDAVSSAEPHVVLDKVTALRCAVIGVDGQRYIDWPPREVGRTMKPAAVDMELELPDVGTIRRLVVLR